MTAGAITALNFRKLKQMTVKESWAYREKHTASTLYTVVQVRRDEVQHSFTKDCKWHSADQEHSDKTSRTAVRYVNQYNSTTSRKYFRLRQRLSTLSFY